MITMSRVIGRVICVGAIVAFASVAHAYETLEADYKICTGGKAQRADVVSACTRLIDNSATENELVGFFYALRATANTDKAQNCRDAKKVMQLIKDPKLAESAKQLEANNC